MCLVGLFLGSSRTWWEQLQPVQPRHWKLWAISVFCQRGASAPGISHSWAYCVSPSRKLTSIAACGWVGWVWRMRWTEIHPMYHSPVFAPWFGIAIVWRKEHLLPTISSVQSLSCVWLFATLWIAARHATLSIANTRNLLKLMSIESVMPSNHLILCHPLLRPPLIFLSIRVFSNESALRIRFCNSFASFCNSPTWMGSLLRIYMTVP